MSQTKKSTLCAACIALCYVLPIAFHSIGAGTVFSPMHIPVLLCGLLCGGLYGALCGILGPVLSSVLSGMPPANMLLTMLPELLVYGLAAGLLMRFVRTGKTFGDIYISMVAAMVCGRIAGGVAKVLFYLGSAQAFTWSMWLSGYFITAVPGIVCHLILVPLLAGMLMKAKVVPYRYDRKEK